MPDTKILKDLAGNVINIDPANASEIDISDLKNESSDPFVKESDIAPIEEKVTDISHSSEGTSISGQTTLEDANVTGDLKLDDESIRAIINKKAAIQNTQAQFIDGTYPRLLKYNDTKLYIFLDNQYRVSEDKGKTWSDPVTLFTMSTETEESGQVITDVGNAYAFLSPKNDGRIVVLYRSSNRDTQFFSICAKVSDTNGENFGARQALFFSTSGYSEPFYYKGWIYYSSEHEGSGSDKAQSIYRRTISVSLFGTVSVGPSTRFLDGRNKIDTDGNVNNKTRLGMISAAPIENGHIFVFESSVNINASTPRPMVVQYCYVKHPEDNPAQPTSAVSLFLGSSGKKCGAPFVTTLDDGRIVISFQTNEKYTGYSQPDIRDSQFVAFVSKREVTYEDVLTADDFVKLTTYEYGKNECGILGSVSNIDGILYKAFTIGKNASSGYFNYGNLVQIGFQYDYPKLWSDIVIDKKLIYWYK